VLALDYGRARCGCAVSDPTGTIVTPLELVERPTTKRGWARLRALAAEYTPERVVVGLPLALDGSDSDQTREARAFAARLQEQLGDGAPVELYDERFTTKLAQREPARSPLRRKDRQASEDSRAAAHLLESWLSAQSG